MGSVLHVTGTSTIELTDFVRINGEKCARLETIIDISRMNIPEELKGDYNCQMKAKSVFFFNIEGRYFMEGKVAVIMSMAVDAPTPKIKSYGQDEEPAKPGRINMSMQNDNLITVSFLGK